MSVEYTVLGTAIIGKRAKVHQLEKKIGLTVALLKTSGGSPDEHRVCLSDARDEEFLVFRFAIQAGMFERAFLEVQEEEQTSYQSKRYQIVIEGGKIVSRRDCRSIWVAAEEMSELKKLAALVGDTRMRARLIEALTDC